METHRKWPNINPQNLISQNNKVARGKCKSRETFTNFESEQGNFSLRPDRFYELPYDQIMRVSMLFQWAYVVGAKTYFHTSLGFHGENILQN